MGQLYDCSSTSEATLKNTCKLSHYSTKYRNTTTTKQNKLCVPMSWNLRYMVMPSVLKLWHLCNVLCHIVISRECRHYSFLCREFDLGIQQWLSVNSSRMAWTEVSELESCTNMFIVNPWKWIDSDWVNLHYFLDTEISPFQNQYKWHHCWNENAYCIQAKLCAMAKWQLRWSE